MVQQWGWWIPKILLAANDRQWSITSIPRDGAQCKCSLRLNKGLLYLWPSLTHLWNVSLVLELRSNEKFKQNQYIKAYVASTNLSAPHGNDLLSWDPRHTLTVSKNWRNSIARHITTLCTPSKAVDFVFIRLQLSCSWMYPPWINRANKLLMAALFRPTILLFLTGGRIFFCRSPLLQQHFYWDMARKMNFSVLPVKALLHKDLLHGWWWHNAS